MTEINELTAQIAAALGPGWYASTDNNTPTLHGPAGLILYTDFADRSNTRLAVSSASYGLHRHIGHTQRPRISVDASRRPAAIAANINTRLLPAARAWKAMLEKGQQTLQRAQCATADTVEALIATGRLDARHYDNDQTHAEVYSTAPGRPGIRAETYGPTIALTIDGLTVEQALELLRAVPLPTI